MILHFNRTFYQDECKTNYIGWVERLRFTHYMGTRDRSSVDTAQHQRHVSGDQSMDTVLMNSLINHGLIMMSMVVIMTHMVTHGKTSLKKGPKNTDILQKPQT